MAHLSPQLQAPALFLGSLPASILDADPTLNSPWKQQTPVLFAGSLRDNLSPFGGHADAELWEALGRAHLSSVAASLPGKLDAVLGEGGSPLSARQRQLLVLACALLMKVRVLVLDGAWLVFPGVWGVVQRLAPGGGK